MVLWYSSRRHCKGSSSASFSSLLFLRTIQFEFSSPNASQLETISEGLLRFAGDDCAISMAISSQPYMFDVTGGAAHSMASEYLFAVGTARSRKLHPPSHNGVDQKNFTSSFSLERATPELFSSFDGMLTGGTIQFYRLSGSRFQVCAGVPVAVMLAFAVA
jgi:hypothetical protein